MTGCEPQTSGIGSDSSTNCATTTAPLIEFLTLFKSSSVQRHIHHSLIFRHGLVLGRFCFLGGLQENDKIGGCGVGVVVGE